MPSSSRLLWFFLLEERGRIGAIREAPESRSSACAAVKAGSLDFVGGQAVYTVLWVGFSSPDSWPAAEGILERPA